MMLEPNRLSFSTDREALMGGRIQSEVMNLDQEVVELSLLLPRGLANALEGVAEERGLTTGQMLRRLIVGLVNQSSQAARA